ncbi:N-acetyl-gamma-glutamyl-phosphate reductase [Gammaproteobacteria bacterium]|nr:N-acetyl-gamma-glutamyl-phosphate reductase [Gammaproteobacteria bacterium]
MIKVGIVGATGYTGVELLRLLVLHPEAEIIVVTSRSEAGKAVTSLFPNLRGHLNLAFVPPDVEALAQCDVVFFATPNGTAMKMVPALLAEGVKVIDLSADFRITDAAEWSQWYGMEHACPDLLSKAVYGLPEANRSIIGSAKLVANPGCYPTAVQLGFLPLIKNNLIDVSRLIADVKSGVSGAGRKAAIGSLLGEASENMRAYQIAGHRHLPEIVQGLNRESHKSVDLLFMPHLTPMIRGIQASLYSTLLDSDVDLQSVFEDFYRDEPFVDVLEPGLSPETRNVRGTNNCQIGVCRPQNGLTAVVLVVEDNLVKGAAGQAIQNMNIMFNLSETSGLNIVAAIP